MQVHEKLRATLQESNLWKSPLVDSSREIQAQSHAYWEYRGGEINVTKRVIELLRQVPERFASSGVFFGAEIEVEDMVFNSFMRDTPNDVPPGLSVHPDGSLRNGIEYVTKPLKFSDLVLVLSGLEEWMRRSLKVPPKFSWRTSTHIHLNVRDMTFEEIGKLALLYSIFELQMFNYAGVNRLNSVFCVPVTKTDLSHNIYNMLVKGNYNALTRDAGWDKYSAFGTYRTFDYGTIEFRHFPGGLDLPRLVKWVAFILSLRVAASSISFDELQRYITTLNTLCNYRELQVLVFGEDLANSLGTPETSIQMLSNGVTFAKKCLVPETNHSYAPNSHMHQFIESIKMEQITLYEEWKQKHPEEINERKKVKYSNILFADIAVAAQAPTTTTQWQANTVNWNQPDIHMPAPDEATGEEDNQQ